jgi:hypothetical protein
MIKILNAIALLSSILLTACGGGGSSTPQSTLSASVLTTLSDSQGVARITDTGKVGLIYAPQISTFTQAMNQAAQQGSSSTLANVDPANFPIISTTATTKTRRGTFTSDGVAYNITALSNNLTNNAGGIYIELPGYADMIMVLGDSLSAVPTGVTHTYVGVLTQNPRSVVAPGQIGTFSMNVNYSSRTFTINGSTTSAVLSGSGVVDVSTGLYASSNMTFSVNGTSYTATLYGNLNGVSANSVSGVFYTNDQVPDYAGSFIGSR